MTVRLSRALTAVTASLLLLASASACGGDDEPEAPPKTTSAASPPSSAEPSDAARPTESILAQPTARSLGPCLLTTAAISDAIAGEWHQTQKDAVGCSFGSDRGGRLGVQRVGPQPAPSRDMLVVGLASARTSCDGPVREIPEIGAFACVESKDTGDLVVGNVIGGDDLWVVIIPGAPGGGEHDPELDAMAAILAQLPAA